MEKTAFMLLSMTEEEKERLKCALEERGRCVLNLSKENVIWPSKADFILGRLSEGKEVELREFRKHATKAVSRQEAVIPVCAVDEAFSQIREEADLYGYEGM